MYGSPPWPCTRSHCNLCEANDVSVRKRDRAGGRRFRLCLFTSLFSSRFFCLVGTDKAKARRIPKCDNWKVNQRKKRRRWREIERRRTWKVNRRRSRSQSPLWLVCSLCLWFMCTLWLANTDNSGWKIRIYGGRRTGKTTGLQVYNCEIPCYLVRLSKGVNISFSQHKDTSFKSICSEG